MNRNLAWMTAAVAGLLTAASGVAWAQRAVRPKDAPAPITGSDDTDQSQPVPTAEPLVTPPSGKTKPSSPPASAAPPDAQGPRRLPDGGIYVKPTFKDDVTDSDLRRANTAAPSVDCSSGECEAIQRKRVADREYAVHVRPWNPAPNAAVTVVTDVSELLDPPDPELGEKKPLEGLSLQAHVEGVGRYQLHALEGSSGSYGFRFTPGAPGQRHITIAQADGSGPKVDVDVQIGRAAAAPWEARPYERPGVSDLDRTMAELGKAWGGLWGSFQRPHADTVALAKVVERLARAGVDEVPGNLTGPRINYADLARGFASAAAKLSQSHGVALRAAMTSIEAQHCERCHMAYAWDLTTDVSAWPKFRLGNARSGSEESE